MEHSRSRDVEAFARTFAPDEQRPPASRRQLARSRLQWLGVGLVLVVAGVAVAVTAWLAYREAIPASMLRRAPGESFVAARERNSRAAPLAGLTAVPLVVAGVWLLAKRPTNESVRLVAGGAAVAFFLSGMLLGLLTS